ncbi:MAG: serine hydrolase [Rhodospirillaceae bacterium]|nr:serine hydrolase [Rhodospirillaceae bacterium]
MTTMRAGKVLGVIVLVLAMAVNIVYWLDPWLWRGYVKFITSGANITSDQRLTPDEEIRGDGSFVLPTATPEARTITDDALKAMETYARAFNSYALIVIHKGVIQDEWYADFWAAQKITQSQSMHKTLQALLIGVAIADGKIGGVNDPVGAYISEWKDDPRGRITLYQLMTMSSGLTEPRFSANPFSDGIRWMNSGFSIDTILRTSMDTWPAGSKYHYNNLNSELLGMVLTRAYQKRYAEILREKLWVPMGGDRAFVHTDRPGGRAYTSCCLGAPAMDWARIGMLLLNKGEVNGNRIVSADWIAQMTTRSPTARHYGLQTWLGYDDPPIPKDAGSTGAVAAGPYMARDTFLTWGRGQQHVWVVPSEDLVVVRIGPSLGRQPIKPGFDVTYLVNMALKGLKPPPQ